MKKLNVGIVGITGLVGQTMLKVLAEYQIQIDNLYLFASSRSKGKEVVFNEKTYRILELNENAFSMDLDVVLFAVDADLSRLYAPLLAKKGVYVIDNSSAFRMDDNVPLIVPEVNIDSLKENNYLIANPNCSTIQSVVPLKVIDDLFTLKEVSYSTYQAVSGSGVNGINDLDNGKKGIEPTFYPKPINDNLIPQIDSFTDSFYTKEELKMVNETNKILNKDLDISATCVRVPIYVGHSVSIDCRVEKEVDIDLLINKLKENESIHVSLNNEYMTPIEVQDTDKVYVSRIRKGLKNNNQLLLFSVADNVRKGAASNAVQILKYLQREFIK